MNKTVITGLVYIANKVTSHSHVRAIFASTKTARPISAQENRVTRGPETGQRRVG